MYWILVVEFQILGIVYWILGVECWILGLEYQILGIVVWILGVECWILRSIGYYEINVVY